MEEIKRIVTDLDINGKRAKMLLNECRLLSIHHEMSNLTFNLPVARCAYLLDELDYEISEAGKTGDGSKIDEVQFQLALLGEDDNIRRYKSLRNKCFEIDRERSEYFQTIDIDFRNAIRNLNVPSIFIFQGYLDKGSNLKIARHIILSDAEEVYKETPSTIIHPLGDLSSKRKLRHFYSRTSFKYLEQVSIDESFDVKTKRLGKIIIK